MDIVRFLKDNWAVIEQAPWVFVAIVVLFGGGGLLIGRYWRTEVVASRDSIIALKNAEIEDYKRKLEQRAPASEKRSLTANQRRRLANAIAVSDLDMSALTIIFSVHGGDETRRYAQEIEAVFKDKGWKGEIGIPMDDCHQLTGLRIWHKPGVEKDPNAKILADVLDAAQIDYEWALHGPPYEGAVLFIYRNPE